VTAPVVETGIPLPVAGEAVHVHVLTVGPVPGTPSKSTLALKQGDAGVAVAICITGSGFTTTDTVPVAAQPLKVPPELSTAVIVKTDVIAAVPVLIGVTVGAAPAIAPGFQV